tara:strand:+ start:819 stop:1232 length:414 start_codon:yes stop_codon:yes gene_type:complete
MGRYYSGDIEGKFAFGIQSSTAADRFGVEFSEPNHVDYYFDEDNLPTVKKELQCIASKFGKNENALITYFDMGYYDYKNSHHMTFPEYLYKGNRIDDPAKYFGDNSFLSSEFYDYLLGYKIMKSIEEMGQCYFQAEL